MALLYRLEVSAPKTATAAAKAWTFTPSTGDFQSRMISCEATLRKDKRAVSYLTAALHDPALSIFNALPDPAYFNIGVRLYLEAPDDSKRPELVFDGKMTNLAFSWPAPTKTTITAHDKSVDMRKNNKSGLQVFHGKTSVQITEQVVKAYGFTTAVDLGTITPRVRKAAINRGDTSTGRLSDWAFCCALLDGDGLEMFMFGDTVTIREKASQVYPSQFTAGRPPVVSLSGSIQHVGTPGEKGDKVTFLAFQDAQTVKALPKGAGGQAAAAQEAAQAITAREPVAAVGTDEDGAHSEAAGNPWGNITKAARRRKDKATLKLAGTADVNLKQIVTLGGWGQKIDGQWEVEEVAHSYFGGDYVSTTLQLHRGGSKGGLAGAGLAFGAGAV